jgi:hypothetical protein
MAGELVLLKRTEIAAINSSDPRVEALMYNIRIAGGISESDLVQVKNPSGGALAFEVAAAGKKPEYLTEIIGIPLTIQPKRTLWADKSIGSGERPVCSSNDLVRGKLRVDDNKQLDIPDTILSIAMPGAGEGKCANCHFNQWDTAIDAKGKPTKGKRCSESRVVYLLRLGDVLPMKITIPSGSIGTFNAAVKQFPVRTDQCVMKLSLSKEKSTSGVDFAQYRVEFVSGLEPDAIASLQEYGELLASVFENSQVDPPSPPQGKGDLTPPIDGEDAF